LFDTTWKAIAPKEALTLISSCQSGKMDYFESLAEQGFQNNFPGRTSTHLSPSLLSFRLLHFQSLHFYRFSICLGHDYS